MSDNNAVQMEEDVIVIDLVRLLGDMWKGFLKFWLLGLLLVVLCPAILCGYLYWNYSPLYEAYTSLTVKVVSRSTSDETDTVYNYFYDQEATDQLDKTFSYIVSSDHLRDEVLAMLGTDRINGTISAESIKDTNLFVLPVYSAEPEQAKAILEAVVQVYPDVVRFVIGEVELDIIEEPVCLEEPYNQPDYLKYMIYGIAIGCVLFGGLLFLYAFLRKTVKDPDDIKANLNVPCLGSLPRVVERRRDRSRGPLVSMTSEMEKEDGFAESMKSVALKVDNIMLKKRAKVLLITSTVPSEGKSTLSLNIAQALVRRGRRVLLLDGNLRKPVLHKCFSLPTDFASLGDVLNKRKTLKEALHYMEKEGLYFLGNAECVEKPTALISSGYMRKLIAAVQEHVDYVIIDAPPCELMTDVAIYWEYVDAAVYTVRSDWASTTQIMHSIRELTENENKLIGFVINGVDGHTNGYGRYGYGKYGYGKYGYGKYGYGKYRYGKYGSYGHGENDYGKRSHEQVDYGEDK